LEEKKGGECNLISIYRSFKMIGTVIWYNAARSQGLIAVTQNGIVQKYFLLESRVARSPEIIKAGQYAKFDAFAPPPRPGLLPYAMAVEISDTPPIDSGITALAVTPQNTEVRL
jgi:hypothetical protein